MSVISWQQRECLRSALLLLVGNDECRRIDFIERLCRRKRQRSPDAEKGSQQWSCAQEPVMHSCGLCCETLVLHRVPVLLNQHMLEEVGGWVIGWPCASCVEQSCSEAKIPRL